MLIGIEFHVDFGSVLLLLFEFETYS